MITLQLERLYLNTPYFVWRNEDGDLFFKKTKKKELRFRLFLRWFNTYEHRDLYVIRTLGVRILRDCHRMS